LSQTLMFQYAYIFATRCRITFNISTYGIYEIKQFKFESVERLIPLPDCKDLGMRIFELSNKNSVTFVRFLLTSG